MSVRIGNGGGGIGWSDAGRPFRKENAPWDPRRSRDVPVRLAPRKDNRLIGLPQLIDFGGIRPVT